MIKTDCINFPLDRPCRFHKQNGIKCVSCGHYAPVIPKNIKPYKILIIKLDAMGDVLRTTFLLPGLKKKYPNCKITWVSSASSSEVLKGNPYIEHIWINDKHIFEKLLSEGFNEVINLDLSPASLALASMAAAKKITGYSLNSARQVVSSNHYAKHWLSMSAFDDLKKANKSTYQYWISKITGLKKPDYPIYVPIAADSAVRAGKFAVKHGLNNKLVVGINPGAGKRWKMKRWTASGYLEIINKLHSRGAKVILLGGPEEESIIRKMLKKSRGKAISAGTNNSIPDFFAFINLCDMVITGDTMALHAALGLKKKAVAIFGPTSEPEIEMYGLGPKVVSGLPCVCCYRQTCDKKPDCMNSIKPGILWHVIEKSLPARPEKK